MLRRKKNKELDLPVRVRQYCDYEIRSTTERERLNPPTEGYLYVIVKSNPITMHERIVGRCMSIEEGLQQIRACGWYLRMLTPLGEEGEWV